MLHVNKFYRYVGNWCEALYSKYLFTASNTRFNVKTEPACYQQWYERPITIPFKLVSDFIKSVDFSEIGEVLVDIWFRVSQIYTKLGAFAFKCTLPIYLCLTCIHMQWFYNEIAEKNEKLLGSVLPSYCSVNCYLNNPSTPQVIFQTNISHMTSLISTLEQRVENFLSFDTFKITCEVML